MEFDSNNLLSNLAYAASVSKVSFEHYLNIINIAKGCIPRAMTPESVKQLEKFDMKPDTHKEYITNIFDYRLYVKDNDPTVVYVLNSVSRELMGTMTFDMADGQINCITNLTSSINTNDLISNGP
ncbi:hypothetical protein [Rachiplusia nu nucleopolyhedrovirus]|uniref:Uncharacterized protein n=1 Tax=Rachiplusia nu nucleopolyhedrovirus TaxID=2605775 RepID=A0AAF1DB27_9ABAC|nr:hypothetical protein QKQ55_gp024 [Rachiplusia nu nucleopolyhedrovirus]QEI03587.1 hypothetical protein [Rachiplusia nu nucleopolyhedrovirus]